MDLKGKAIVITGAAQGLGREMAKDIAQHGAKLALVDLHRRLRKGKNNAARRKCHWLI
jgi:NAD(P)-dependent dehydrogenase (short-subunit alcohol dehydrogenase family)